MNASRLRQAKILIVDDEKSQLTLLESILRAAGYTRVWSTHNPCQVAALTEDIRPDLIVLDLHMPRLDGFGVMAQVQVQALTPPDQDEDHPAVPLPILVVSGDYSHATKLKALEAGAKDFLPRPFDALEIQLRIQNLLEARFLQLQLQAQNLQLEDSISERTQDLEQTQLRVKEAQLEIISRLALAGELHDAETGQHTQRVSLIASLIAQNLNLAPEIVELLHRAAPLHDVGKIGVADPILMKRGPLTDKEYQLLKEHCRIGAQVLSGGNAELIQMAERIALSHHENWDGTGYPQGLRGEQIPLEARILAVADVFDALTHVRPYKGAWPIAAALREIRSLRGTHFDPQVVDAFLELPHESLI